jgi:sec-independent protein translocase protein TatA
MREESDVFGLDGQELMVIFLLAMVVLFGSKRLPDIGKGLGKGIREFKRAIDLRTEDEEPAPRTVDILPQ